MRGEGVSWVEEGGGGGDLGGVGGVLPSLRTMVRVRFWIDSSITSERTSIMAFDCSSEKPSALRRWTNFRVSKWWSR